MKFLWLNTFGFNMIELFVLQPHKFGDNKETNAIIVKNNTVVKYGYWNSLLTSVLVLLLTETKENANTFQ